MTPEESIAMLDRQLAAHGQDVTLRRLTGTQLIPFDVVCRAFVRGYGPDELTGTIAQGDSLVILSPTEIEANDWPGPNSSATPDTSDRRVPRKGDKVVIAGRVRNVEAPAPIYLGGELVRINLQVRG